MNAKITVNIILTHTNKEERYMSTRGKIKAASIWMTGRYLMTLCDTCYP